MQEQELREALEIYRESLQLLSKQPANDEKVKVIGVGLDVVVVMLDVQTKAEIEEAIRSTLKVLEELEMDSIRDDGMETEDVEQGEALFLMSLSDMCYKSRSNNSKEETRSQTQHPKSHATGAHRVHRQSG